MSFIPTGPLTFSSMLIVFALAAYGFVLNKDGARLIAAALLVSWVGARTATVTESQYLLVLALTIAATLSWTAQSAAGRAITFLYGLRILIASFLSFGVIDWFFLWEANRVFLYMQFIIFGGSLMPDRGKRLGISMIRSVINR